LRADAAELSASATLVLRGPAGLTLVLDGGPPPGKVTVRTAVNGHAGVRLRRAAEAKGVPQVDAPDLARRLALMAELAAIWPTT
jgi:flagellar biosynthetic protein FlhB